MVKKVYIVKYKDTSIRQKIFTCEVEDDSKDTIIRILMKLNRISILKIKAI